MSYIKRSRSDRQESDAKRVKPESIWFQDDSSVASYLRNIDFFSRFSNNIYDASDLELWTRDHVVYKSIHTRYESRKIAFSIANCVVTPQSLSSYFRVARIDSQGRVVILSGGQRVQRAIDRGETNRVFVDYTLVNDIRLHDLPGEMLHEIIRHAEVTNPATLYRMRATHPRIRKNVEDVQDEFTPVRELERDILKYNLQEFVDTELSYENRVEILR